MLPSINSLSPLMFKIRLDDNMIPVGLQTTKPGEFQFITRTDAQSDRQWAENVQNLYHHVKPFILKKECSIFEAMLRDKNLCMRTILPAIAKNKEFVKKLDQHVSELFKNEKILPAEIKSSLKHLNKIITSPSDFQVFFDKLISLRKLIREQAIVFKFYCTSLLNTSPGVDYQSAVSIFKELRNSCHPDRTGIPSELFSFFLSKEGIIQQVITEDQWNSTQWGSTAEAIPASPSLTYGSTKTKTGGSLYLLRPLEQAIIDETGKSIPRPLEDFISDTDVQSMHTVNLQQVAIMLDLDLLWMVKCIKGFIEFLYDKVTSREAFNDVAATRENIKRMYKIHLGPLADKINSKKSAEAINMPGLKIPNPAFSELNQPDQINLAPLQKALEEFAAINENKIKKYKDIAENARCLARILDVPMAPDTRWFQRYDRFEVRRTYLGRFRNVIDCQSLDEALIGDYVHRKEIPGLLDHFPSVLFPEWENVDILNKIFSKTIGR